MSDIGSQDILDYVWRLSFDLNAETGSRELIIFENIKRINGSEVTDIGTASYCEDGTVEIIPSAPDLPKQYIDELRQSFEIVGKGYINGYHNRKADMTDADLFKVTGDKSLTFDKINKKSS